MANLKASKKDVRRTITRTARNKKMTAELDKAVKAVKKEGSKGVNKVYALLDKLTSRGILKKNTAARKKSQIAAKAKNV